MSKRFIISEEEKNDIRSIYGLVNEQMNHQEPIDSQLRKVKPEMGGKYCFGKQTLQQLKSNIGNRNLLLHKVKTGDTLSGIAAQHPGTVSESELINTNKGCELSKGLRAGDVIIMSIVPSM
jgi:LysM repeat protein